MIRIANGQGHIGAWWVVVPLVLAVIGLATATVLARRWDWLGATAVTGTTELLVSPISWAHHWVWVLPALVLLLRAGHRIAAGTGYLLFAAAPFWFTPHAAGPREYGFHWLVTLVANCFLLAGLAFGGYMALTQLRPARRAETQAEDLDAFAGLRAGLEGLLHEDAAVAVFGTWRRRRRRSPGWRAGRPRWPDADPPPQGRAGVRTPWPWASRGPGR